MPIVPTFTRDDLPQAMPTGPQADVGIAGLADETLAKGAASLGADATEYLRQHLEQENYDYVATNAAAARTKATDGFLARSAAAQRSGNYDGLADQTRADIQADQQQRLQSAPSQHAAAALTKIYANLQDEFVTKASVFQGDGNRSNWASNVEANLDQSRTVAFRDPTQADAAMGQAMAIIKGGAAAGLGAKDIEKATERARNEIYGAAAQNLLQNNPAALSASLKAGHFDKVLSEPQLAAFQDQADARVKAAQAAAKAAVDAHILMTRGSVESDFRDNIASISDTGKMAVPMTRENIAAVYPYDPQRVDRMWSMVTDAQRGYVSRQTVALQSPTDDVALLAKLKPAGAGYEDQATVYNATLGAIQQKQKQLADDPAAYVQKTAPQVASLFAAAAKDPSVLPKAVAAQDAIYDTLGVPMGQRSVLPKPQAAAVASKLANIDPTKGDVGAALDQMAKNYGDAWPRVFKDLVSAGLPPGTEALANMDAPNQAGDRQDMQRAIAFAAQKGGSKALQDLTPSATPVIKTAVPDALAAFRQSVVIPGAASNPDLLAKVSNLIELKARYNVLQGQDPQSAVTSAYDSIIGKKYDFDGTLRVPKGMLSQVHYAADQALAALKPSDLQATANLPPDIGLDRWTSAKFNSEWVTTPGDDGIMLLTQQRDGSRIRVLRKDGSPVVIPFSEAAKVVVPPLAPLDDEAASTMWSQ